MPKKTFRIEKWDLSPDTPFVFRVFEVEHRLLRPSKKRLVGEGHSEEWAEGYVKRLAAYPQLRSAKNYDSHGDWWLPSCW